MRRRALVSQPRVPAFDQDAGSQVVEAIIRFLLEDDWSVTFLADTAADDERHARRLRHHGVATFTGFSAAPEVLSSGEFDLAVLAFWEPASRLLPLIRASSPGVKIIVHSIDLHFMREARRRFGLLGGLDDDFGAQLVRELNTYDAADAVLAVSEKEAQLVSDFLGPGQAHHLPLAESVGRSPLFFEERRGILFVGNFRHLPNGEALEFLCRDIVPLIDPDLLAGHPLTVIGNRLDDKVRAYAGGLQGVNLVGWVPSVAPYLERARLCVVPLLTGAGVKGKVIQALMTGTPVVTTPIGAEGLDLISERHALIAETPANLANSINRMLTDSELWNRLLEAGADHVRVRHGFDHVRALFLDIVADVLGRPARASDVPEDGFRHGRQRAEAYRATKAAVAATITGVTEPGSIVLVTTKGDADLLQLDGRVGWHFPRDADGQWAGFNPADSDSAIEHLEALRTDGARYLALPSTTFWWLRHYRELAAYLEQHYRQIYSDGQVVVFDIGPSSGSTAAGAANSAHRERVLVLGTHGEGRAGPHVDMAAELSRSNRYSVTQRWQPGQGVSTVPDVAALRAGDGKEWLILLDDTAVLPPGFVDDFLTLMTALHAERAQPAHSGGPDAGPPITERLRGCVAREVCRLTPLPVLAVRPEATVEGPVVVVDAVPIRLDRPLVENRDPSEYSRVLDIYVEGPNGPSRAVRRGSVPEAPGISVLLSTYSRPDLLAGCLEGFSGQTLDRSAFEVVVVDDGSPDDRTGEVIERFADDLPLVWARIDHAGRAPAKNLAVLLARGEVVLFFDDDDRPAPDLLDKHLEAHRTHPDEGVAILGYTGWAPELTVTPLMHYLTEVDRMLFSYGNLTEGQELDWRGFWEGRVSCKRRLLVRHGLHDQRLAYSIDVELAWRLAVQDLRVVYEPAARSHMARGVTFDDFCRRIEAKGRAHALFASLHGPESEDVMRYTKVAGAAERWEAARASLAASVGKVRELEAQLGDRVDPDDPRLGELHRCYRATFGALEAKGLAEGAADSRPTSPPTIGVKPGVQHSRSDNGQVASRGDFALTVTVPVWSITPELADMAVRTIDRIRDLARIPTEIVVVDNGSPHQRHFPARVHRFDENRGVATAWNTGIELARAPVVAVLNSDCLVEPGWDEALYEAATDGRRIAFPHTDHGDGLGFRQPDQAGTAGWCFTLTVDLFREIGPFDERFNPAYCEDTDYWHRAWQLDVELAPVPAARVSHARRTTAAHDPHLDWLIQGHRYLYGWKHGVDPLRAPPYYHRPIVEYQCRGQAAGLRA